MKELRYSGSEASVNSFASVDAIELPLAKSEAASLWSLPITNVTAIVSPTALPSPRKTAPSIPFMP